jgi:sensor domain CHASE-containing protein
MLFVWAFSSSTKKSLKNYARAALILALIGVVLVVVVSIILAVCGISIFDEFFRSGYYYH